MATHIVLLGYGHWLPNDLRGSHSETVHIPQVAELGPLHKGRKIVQPPASELREFHRQAEEALRHTVHWFSLEDRDAIRDAFARIHKEHRLTSYACAILPNHVHILVRRHALQGHRIHDLLKQHAAEAVRHNANLSAEHPVFSAGRGTQYKFTPAEVYSCARYIANNFAKHKLPYERYEFVKEYDGWNIGRNGTGRGPQCPRDASDYW